MLPLPILMAESDVAATIAAEQSIASSVTDVGQGSALTGGEVALAAATAGPRVAWGAGASGLYALGQPIAIGAEDAGDPASTFSVSLGLSGGFTTSPRTSLALRSSAFCATSLGVRATDERAARDPFSGERTQYALGGGAGLRVAAAPRASVDLTTDYEQAGAIAAADPAAQGIDAHSGSGRVSVPFAHAPNGSLAPELRYQVTHFYNALYDVNFTRGPADVHAGTAALRAEQSLSRRAKGSAIGGVTVATPPPLLQAGGPVVAPDVGASLTYAAGRASLEASYAWSYTSLGPRIGFGQEHAIALQADTRPLEGGRHRDLALRGVARFAYGTMPVAANPPLGPVVGAPQPAPDATVTSLTSAVGVELEVPLVSALRFVGKLDLEIARGTVDPSPAGTPPLAARTIATIGLAGVFSTRRERTLRPSLDVEPDERAAADRAATDERVPDRTVVAPSEQPPDDPRR